MDVVIDMAAEGGCPRGWDGPIELLMPDSTNKLHFQHGIEKLKQLNCPLVVICVTGIYRTGKSYLLNRLAKLQNGFKVSASSALETKGIWIWYVGPNADKSAGILLVDTHGLGDPDTNDSEYDKKILCLSTVLSSLLIYNCRGEVDASVMERFTFINKLRQSTADPYSPPPVKSFPEFVLMVRDVQFDVEIDGKEVTENEYMEYNLFTPSPKFPKAQNDLISKFKDCFPSRTCVTLPMPATSKKIKNLQDFSDTELDEDFVKKYNEFCTDVISCVPIKRFNYITNLTGKKLADLLVFVMDELEKNPRAYVDNIINTFVQRENARAVDENKNVVNELLSSYLRDFPAWLSSNYAPLEELCQNFVTGVTFEENFTSCKLLLDYLNQSIVKLLTKHYTTLINGNIRSFVRRIQPKVGITHEWFLECLSICCCCCTAEEQYQRGTTLKFPKVVDVIEQDISHESQALKDQINKILTDIGQIARELQKLNDKCRKVARDQQKQQCLEKNSSKRMKTAHDEASAMEECERLTLLNDPEIASFALTEDELVDVFLNLREFDPYICRKLHALSSWLRLKLNALCSC